MTWRMLKTRSFASTALLVVAILAIANFASALGAPNDYQIGFPAHADFSGSEFESVQLNNGNLHIEIPLSRTSGRGLSTSFKYVYDSKGWGIKEHCSHIDPTDCVYWVELTCSPESARN